MESLRGVSLAGRVRAKVSAYADDIIVFVFRRMDILAVKKAVERYKKVTGAKVIFDKSEGLQLCACKSGAPLPWPFRWSDGPIRFLGVWFWLGLQLERNWLEVRAKVETQVGVPGFKGQGGGMCRVHLPFDSLLSVCTLSTKGSSGGAGTILLQTPLEWSNPVGP